MVTEWIFLSTKPEYFFKNRIFSMKNRFFPLRTVNFPFRLELFPYKKLFSETKNYFPFRQDVSLNRDFFL
jgi:hypothetical protein